MVLDIKRRSFIHLTGRANYADIEKNGCRPYWHPGAAEEDDPN